MPEGVKHERRGHHRHAPRFPFPALHLRSPWCHDRLEIRRSFPVSKVSPRQHQDAAIVKELRDARRYSPEDVDKILQVLFLHVRNNTV